MVLHCNFCDLIFERSLAVHHTAAAQHYAHLFLHLAGFHPSLTDNTRPIYVQLCDSLRLNTSIKNLNLSNNHFGESGAEKLRAALTENTTIKFLDLSRNALGFRSINALMCSCSSNGMLVQTNGNFVFEEILNSLSHGLAFLASVVGANLLIAQVRLYLTESNSKSESDTQSESESESNSETESNFDSNMKSKCESVSWSGSGSG